MDVEVLIIVDVTVVDVRVVELVASVVEEVVDVMMDVVVGQESGEEAVLPSPHTYIVSRSVRHPDKSKTDSNNGIDFILCEAHEVLDNMCNHRLIVDTS
ncbi:MAG: hypothetical protein ABIH11_07505 [Candidatus Altiarchaeota archaeon]